VAILGGQLDGAVVEGVGMDPFVRHHQTYDLAKVALTGHEEP
jgi:hypothetical protein